MAQSQKPPAGPIRLGDVCPDFDAETTQGRINFYEQIKDNWAIVFAFPDDFTPVATTELITFTQLQSEFAKRGVRLFALSANNTRGSWGGFESHAIWVRDIDELSSTPIQFPIISDADGTISRRFNVLGEADAKVVASDDAIGNSLAFRSRTVFIIDNQKRFRLIFNYPAEVGFNTAEVLRVVDCLQTAASAEVRTPANWVPGVDVVVPPGVTDEQAKKKFPGYKTLKSYLRVYSLPTEKTSVEKIQDIPEAQVEQFLAANS